MDEEEQQQSDSKINVSSFFERVDSIDKVANSALSKSNANLGIINTHKLLLNSINVSIEAMQTKIRDIANYIIIQQKAEKDAEEDRLFEQQDEAQKGSMLERLAGLKSNNESEQTQTQPGEEPKKGGGGILGTLLTLGIGAFALKFLWPAILPAVGGLLKGALAKAVAFTIGGIGSLIKGVIASSGLTKIGFLGIGGLFTWLANTAKDNSDKAAKSAEKKIKGFKFNEKGEVTGSDSLDIGGGEGGTEGGAEDGGKEIVKENLVNGDKSMRDTLTEKELMVTPGTRIDEEGALGGGKPSSGDLSMFKEEKTTEEVSDGEEVYVDNTGEYGPDKDDKDVQPGDIHGIAEGIPYNYLQHAKHLIHSRERKFKMAEMYPQDKERHLKAAERLRLKIVEFDRRFPQVTELLKGKDKQYYEEMKNYSVESDVQNKDVEENIDVEIANKDLDQNLSENFSDQFLSINNQLDTLSEDFTGSINAESGQMFSRPSNSPNTTVTIFKQTSSNTAFTNMMKNNYLSLNKTQEAEILRYMK